MNRPQFLEPDGKTITQAWRDLYEFKVTDPNGKVLHAYCPTPKGLEFHESVIPNCIIEGSRGTGKSTIIRNDAHMRALASPNYTYLIIRRTMPELKLSHLKYISTEMRAFGGDFHKTDNIATYPNGSKGFFRHCETEDDMLKLLSSEYDVVYFDEISTFTWTMITKVSSCVRVAEGSGKIGLVRGGTNPIGVGAAEIKRYYILKDVRLDEDDTYDPSLYQAIHTTLDDNPFIDRKDYIRRLSNLPEHIRRAWLDGEWIVEGAYFHDFKATRNFMAGDEGIPPSYKHIVEMNGGYAAALPWHVVNEYPTISNRMDERRLLSNPFEWIQVYRAIDWGFSPDPCVCLWIAVLPNGRAFVMKEKTYKSTTAAEVAKDIVQESDGYRVVETYCDPSMFFGSEATDFVSVGDIFEANGVPLTPSKNDRTAAGYAIHEFLNSICDDGLPKLQIYEPKCVNLVRTLPEIRHDKNNPEKIADGNDHWVIALAYYCMGRSGVSREYVVESRPRWMRPNPRHRKGRYVLGSESVR